MRPLLRTHLPIALALLAGFVAPSADAQLAANSPFLAPQASAATPTAGAPLEFGGYLDTPGGDRLYRIKDPARKTSDWVRLNERNATFDVVAKQYDEGNDTLTLEYQGRTLTLAKRESKILSAGAAPQPMPMPVAMPMNAVSPAVTQSVVVNPTPADEQRRLEAVATEVARRRALREQATQQINQGVPPQVVAPQAQPAQRNFQPQRQNQQNQQQQQQQQNFQRRGQQRQGR